MKKLILLVATIALISSCNLHSNDIAQKENIIVREPKMNEVTYEISEKLIGKYVVENDPEMYFEIKPDGKFDISLNANSGYARYNEETVQFTALYSDIRTIISFNITSGLHSFGNVLSISFMGNPECTSFLSTTYWSYLNLEFIKQP
ncbi:MAG: hypothetical protein FWH05_00440 [Oscillospiraceae bacterium]|nr:hypothetical protein [Oscillospiraceae bacterium]